VHLFDFDRDLYGQYVAVDFLQKLRDERHFNSLDELRMHILQDIDAARGYFRARPSSLPTTTACVLRQ
jgi:riboflavin kinase / FMN adenylyltransferase